MAGGRSYWLFRDAVPLDPESPLSSGVPTGQPRGKTISMGVPTPQQKARRREMFAAERWARTEKRRAFDRSLRPPPVDVSALRRKLGMSRTWLARCIGVPVGTLRHWERGDRKPRGAALVLLNLLARNSQATLRALAPRGFGPRGFEPGGST